MQVKLSSGKVKKMAFYPVDYNQINYHRSSDLRAQSNAEIEDRGKRENIEGKSTLINYSTYPR